MKLKNMTTLHLGKSIGPECFRGFLLLALACFALAPALQAVTPAPDGGYANQNTAEGQNALFSLTTGAKNTANGYLALFFNTSGRYNTAVGSQALYSNSTGVANTANGMVALLHNTSGGANTAIGYGALYFNTAGNYNTATGNHALYSNTIGVQNTASGDGALYNNTTGNRNTANGYQALYSNTTGNSNIALGGDAGFSLTTGSNNIDIGSEGAAGEDETIRIGSGQSATYIAGIYGVNEGGTISVVYINSNGQLGTQGVASSRRFKKEIKAMDQTSQAILALKPVTFQYKSDTKGTPQFGLIAEEVAKVNPDLVVRDSQGEIYSVRYEAVNAMLLNEFLKAHRKMQEQEASITQLKSTVAQQQKDFQAAAAHQQEQIEALTADLQRVSAEVEMSRPAPQMVLNDQ
jgi:Chaperone of endosialidase